MDNKNIQLGLQLLRNEVNSDVARLTTHVQNLSCNKSGFKLHEYRLLMELSHLLLNKFALGR